MEIIHLRGHLIHETLHNRAVPNSSAVLVTAHSVFCLNHYFNMQCLQFLLPNFYLKYSSLSAKKSLMPKFVVVCREKGLLEIYLRSCGFLNCFPLIKISSSNCSITDLCLAFEECSVTVCPCSHFHEHIRMSRFEKPWIIYNTCTEKRVPQQMRSGL